MQKIREMRLKNLKKRTLAGKRNEIKGGDSEFLPGALANWPVPCESDEFA